MTSQTAAQTYHRPELSVHRWKKGRLRVVVAHRLRLLAPALGVSLADRAQVLSQTIFGAALVALAEVLEPDVVVMGDALEDGRIERFLPALVRTGARLLVIQEETDHLRSLRLLRNGVDGLILMDIGLDAMATDVMRLSAGEAVVPSAVTATLLREWRRQPAASPTTNSTGLTAREQEVLAAIVDGLGAKALARKLGISVKTVENHKTRIYQKLGVRSNAEAISIATSTVGWSG